MMGIGCVQDNFNGWWAGFNYNYLIPITPVDKPVHLDFLAGGGAGVGLRHWRSNLLADQERPLKQNVSLPHQPMFVATFVLQMVAKIFRGSYPCWM